MSNKLSFTSKKKSSLQLHGEEESVNIWKSVNTGDPGKDFLAINPAFRGGIPFSHLMKWGAQLRKQTEPQDPLGGKILGAHPRAAPFLDSSLAACAEEGVAVHVATVSNVGENEGCSSSWWERGPVYEQSARVWPGFMVQGQGGGKMFSVGAIGNQAWPMTEEPQLLSYGWRAHDLGDEEGCKGA